MEVGFIGSGARLITVTIPVILLVLYCVQKFYLRTSRQLRFLDLEAKSPLYAHFTDTLNGLDTIRAFGWEKAFKAQNIKHLDVSQKPFYLLYCIQRWLNLVLDFVVAALAVLLVTIAIEDQSITSGGAIGIALNNVLGFNISLANLVNSWTTLETSLGAISRLKSFEKETKVESQPGESDEPPGQWPTNGSIEIRNVSVFIGTNPILQDISISIESGEKLDTTLTQAIISSGKSSLVLTLFRLLTPTSGSIVIDDLDTAHMPRDALRARLTTIPQDPVFIPGSIRFNLDPHALAADSQIITAVKRIGLWDLISASGGLDGDIHGLKMSEGQKQLFAWGRALQSNSKILVVDEATSSIDTRTEALVQDILRTEFKAHTVISVAHRLSTIINFDRILVLEGGRVVEFDEPAALLKRESKFRKLWDNQH
ncbi:MAG: hypothetical protein Q9187_008507 [Circinaria calcarea]